MATGRLQNIRVWIAMAQAEEYIAGLRKVRAARERGEEPSEDLLEELDALWYAMDDAEHARLKDLAKGRGQDEQDFDRFVAARR